MHPMEDHQNEDHAINAERSQYMIWQRRIHRTRPTDDITLRGENMP